MRQLLVAIIKKSPLHTPLRNLAVRMSQKKALAQWERQGKPAPPPHIVKQQTLLEYSRRYGLRTLVETGTCYGDMVEAMRRDFDRIYSVELSPELFERAQRRFRRARNVELIQGDSGVELVNIVNQLEEPALFWLDGHFSGGDTAKGAKETPIAEELRHILDGPVQGHVVIVDDARLFGTDPAYPTIGEFRALVSNSRPDLDVRVQDDSIRVAPRE